jgi:hypothetical protein
VRWQQMTPHLFYVWGEWGLHATVIRCETWWKTYWHTYPSTWPIAYYTLDEAVRAAHGPRPVLGGAEREEKR